MVERRAQAAGAAGGARAAVVLLAALVLALAVAALRPPGAQALSITCVPDTGEATFAGASGERNRVVVGYRAADEGLRIKDLEPPPPNSVTCAEGDEVWLEVVVALDDENDSLRLDGKGLGGAWGTLRAGVDVVGSGGEGRDSMRGHPGIDTFSGGDGRDELLGGADADVLAGAAGRDLIVGGSGPDEIGAVDGADDRVRCGKGYDRVTADPGDDLAGCEVVS